jgi:hypothetical protein
VREASVHPRFQVGASGRPFNFTVRRRMKLRRFETQRAAGAMGLFSAPFGPCVVLLWSQVPDSFLYAAGWFAFLYVMSLLFTSLLGLPFLFLVARSDLLRWWLLLPGGALLGASVPLLLVGASQTFAAALYGSAGFLAALIFWISWNFGPDPSAAAALKWTKSFTRFA